MPKDLDNIYTYHPPFGAQPAKYEQLRAKAKELAKLYEELCPESRELSIAHTELESSLMWANASIARNEKI